MLRGWCLVGMGWLGLGSLRGGQLRFSSSASPAAPWGLLLPWGLEVARGDPGGNHAGSHPRSHPLLRGEVCCSTPMGSSMGSQSGVMEGPHPVPAPLFPAPGTRGRVPAVPRHSPAPHAACGTGAYQRGCKNQLLPCINIFTLLSSH